MESFFNYLISIKIGFKELFFPFVFVLLVFSFFYESLNITILGLSLFILISIISSLKGFKISLIFSFVSVFYLFFISYLNGVYYSELVHASVGYFVVSFFIGKLVDSLKNKEDSLIKQIHKRKYLEKKLKRNKNHLESIFSAVPDTIVHFNENGKILYVWSSNDNDPYFIKNRLVGKTFSCIANGLNEKILKSVENLSKDDVSITEFKIQSDNKNRFYEARLSLINNDFNDFKKDNSLEYIASIRDISASVNINKELERKRALFGELFSSNPDAIVLLSNEDEILRVNKSFEELFKYSEHNIIGRKINDLVVSEEKINEAKDLSYDAINGEEFYLETVRKSKDGINIDVSISTAPIIINGTQIGFFAIYRDIRKRKIAELEKERKSSLLKALLSNFPDPVYFKNKKREFILANDLAAKDLGLESKKEIIGKKDDDFLSGRVLKETIEEENKVMDDLEPMRKVKKVGDNRWASVTKAPYIDINGKLKGIIGINQDITERKKTELELKKERNRIEYISFHDELTGLYNRRFFEEEMKRFENSRVKPIAIVVADLDNLKVVNDTYGHDKGDEYIINAAKSLKKVTREEDIVARLGGDEFSMILPEVSKKDAESFCERVRKECSKKNVSISLGYAIKKSSDKGLEKTFTKADKKMYEEKRNKRGSRC